MKKSRHTLAKHARMYAIDLWGMMSVVWLSGEPIDDMSSGRFCLLKGIGIASLILCGLVGKRLYKAGLLPEMNNGNGCKI